jgi:hypothetical protein
MRSTLFGFVAVFAIVALSARAATDAVPAAIPPPPPTPIPMPPPGGVIVSPDGRTVISSTICPDLVGGALETPGAAYKPGIDVDGKPVAPADLPAGAGASSFDNVPIEIGADLRNRLGNAATSGLFGRRSTIGLVTVIGSDAYFNGRPISDSERAVLVAACHASGR